MGLGFFTTLSTLSCLAACSGVLGFAFEGLWGLGLKGSLRFIMLSKVMQQRTPKHNNVQTHYFLEPQ